MSPAVAALGGPGRITKRSFPSRRTSFKVDHAACKCGYAAVTGSNAPPAGGEKAAAKSTDGRRARRGQAGGPTAAPEGADVRKPIEARTAAVQWICWNVVRHLDIAPPLDWQSANWRSCGGGAIPVRILVKQHIRAILSQAGTRVVRCRRSRSAHYGAAGEWK